MKKWMPILRTWILPMAILLGLNIAFLSPAYFNGNILDQDDIKLGWAKSKEIRDYREATGKNRFGPTLCSVECLRHKSLPNTAEIFLNISPLQCALSEVKPHLPTLFFT